LFHSEPVLGIIWDDAFLGDDGMLGGGDIFIYEQQEMERVAHLGRFPVLTNSGMYQPRLSALGILKSMPNKMHWERRHFSDVEWQAYLSELENANLIETSSVQQLLEGIASLFGLAQVNAHRGHALLQLEQLAYTCTYPVYDYYRLPLENGQLNLKSFLIELMEDWQQKEDINVIAWKVFFSLAKVVEKLSNHYYIDHIAFSGTVFKSSLLTDMIIEQLKHKRKLYFHKQVCSGSECISIGQMAYYYCLQPRA
jgi:hydrogenase maturation protein HypF